MSEQIDWSKAPEVAMVLLKHVRDNRYAWAVSHAEESDAWMVEGTGFKFRLMESCWRVASTRQTTPSWSGEGLPPVGVDIEVLHELYGWIGARVVGQDGEAAIVRTNDGYAGVFPHQMRPIRTPEQIAADERERFAQELVTAMGKGGGPNALYQARRMYDLGYRKP